MADSVTVNAIAPSARTRMTETVFADMMAKPDSGFDAMAPENISPLVVWLGSVESGDVTGRVFEVEGGVVRVAEGWARGPEADKAPAGIPPNWAPSFGTCLPRLVRRFRCTAPDRQVTARRSPRESPRIGPGLVIVEACVHRGQLRPVPGPLILGGVAGLQVEHLVLDLNGHSRIGLQIQIPHRIAQPCPWMPPEPRDHRRVDR